MLTSYRSQDEAALSKEELRIQAKRQANEERRRRFLDARKRLIGQDVQALDQQVLEKQKNKAYEKDLDKLERLRIIEIQRILEASAEEERIMKENEKKALLSSWNESIQDRRNRLQQSIDEFLPEPTISSAQVFEGEDINQSERILKQQEQMKSWINEQINEKYHNKLLSKQEELKYIEMLKAINDVREAAENEEKTMKDYLTETFKNENLRLADIQRNQRLNENKIFLNDDQDTILKATSLDIPTDNDLAVDEYGRIRRRDMFRGYTDAQRRRILQENEDIIQNKLNQAEEDKQYEASWAAHDAMLTKAMENAQYEDQKLRENQRIKQSEIIKLQIDEQRRARELSNDLKRGAIGTEFFSNFGTSHR
eukprot:gene18506-24223_t